LGEKSGHRSNAERIGCGKQARSKPQVHQKRAINGRN
jgi:hypothetical protein